MTTILRNARLADGRMVDLTVDDERITAVHTAASGGPGGAGDGVVEHDLGSKLVVPAFAEPHAHLDKAFTADRVPNPACDLASWCPTPPAPPWATRR